MFDAIMTDFETLGTDSPKVMPVSFAAVPFERNRMYTLDEIFKLRDEAFTGHFSIDQMHKLGYQLEEKTLLWWMRQSQDAQDSAFKAGAQCVFKTMQEYYDWLAVKAGTQGIVKLKLYSRGAFDARIQQNLFNDCDIVYPFAYDAARDVRQDLEHWTLETKPKWLMDKCKQAGFVQHSALDDCLAQIYQRVLAREYFEESLT